MPLRAQYKKGRIKVKQTLLSLMAYELLPEEPREKNPFRLEWQFEHSMLKPYFPFILANEMFLDLHAF